jgi:hypothetical protein
MDYIKAHWRGDLSLARSYWLNVILLSALFGVGGTLLEQPLSEQPVANVATVGLALIIVAAVVTVWQFVGVWRSATNTSIKSGHKFWPAVAKAATVFGCLMSTGTVITTAHDLVKILVAIQDPTLMDYEIERVGDTDLIFRGAINEKSVSEIIGALEDSSIEILCVRSHGGIIPAAIRLARHIRGNEIMVMAEEQCISACVILLAASPSAAIYPGTKVTFHRFESVAEFTSPEIRAQNTLYLAEAEGIFREFGVADWAIETAGRQQFWTPTVDQLIGMGLIVYIYDSDQKLFVAATEFCVHDPERCSY